ncbi:hypothetical protein PVAG01_10031 [Phlyctema vagabunda]|uniref:Cyclin N-terminal domain-containing protein n=1 Tax=Phlyctema vagabunda TaxID=108571 RepID=A0ABR4P4T4_9HELO
MKSSLTPPMAPSERNMSISSVDSFDEEYFLKTYVPLSNLPTPPLSAQSSSSSGRIETPKSLNLSFDELDPDLLGPSIYMTNLIPSSTSLITPSIPLIHAILTRANLPLETLAMAVCILDSLNSKFALSWRRSCPLETPPTSPIRSTFPDEYLPTHIDTVRPELIAVSALILATKFVHDAQQDTIKYIQDWELGFWSCDQVNYTQRCLLENLGYRLMPLWQEHIIIEALENMERAGNQIDSWEDVIALADETNVKSFQGVGDQLTPAGTPVDDALQGNRSLPAETKDAFSRGGNGTMGKAITLHIPNKRSGEPFPEYVDSFINDAGLGV